jgi:hypothetical protein
MTEARETVAGRIQHLRSRAAKARELSVSLTDSLTIERMTVLAGELEAQADALQSQAKAASKHADQ